MERQIVKLFQDGESQTVTLPEEFQFEGTEVYIYKQGDQVILAPKQRSWQEFFENAPLPSDDFMAERVDLPLQERENLF